MIIYRSTSKPVHLGNGEDSSSQSLLQKCENALKRFFLGFTVDQRKRTRKKHQKIVMDKKQKGASMSEFKIPPIVRPHIIEECASFLITTSCPFEIYNQLDEIEVVREFEEKCRNHRNKLKYLLPSIEPHLRALLQHLDEKVAPEGCPDELDELPEELIKIVDDAYKLYTSRKILTIEQIKKDFDM
jgi:hypothetical protein